MYSSPREFFERLSEPFQIRPRRAPCDILDKLSGETRAEVVYDIVEVFLGDLRTARGELEECSLNFVLVW